MIAIYFFVALSGGKLGQIASLLYMARLYFIFPATKYLVSARQLGY